MTPHYPALSPLAESGRLWLAALDMARRVPDLARRAEAVALCDRQNIEHAGRYRLTEEESRDLAAGHYLAARANAQDPVICEALREALLRIDARLCELEAEPEEPGLREEHGLARCQMEHVVRRQAA